VIHVSAPAKVRQRTETGVSCAYAECNSSQTKQKDDIMSIGTILLILLVLMLVGAMPTWPHSHSWGYGPSGGLGLLLLIVVILLVTGRI
jgi:hypothetical protein